MNNIQTASFISYYCHPINEVSGYSIRDNEDILRAWNRLQDKLHDKVNLDLVANTLKSYYKNGQYDTHFLRTRYWLIVRNYILYRDGFMCNISLSDDNRILHVHHKTYEWHGYEASHPECLTTLCDSCHSKYHDKEKSKETNQTVTPQNNEYLIDKLLRDSKKLSRVKPSELVYDSNLFASTLDETIYRLDSLKQYLMNV